MRGVNIMLRLEKDLENLQEELKVCNKEISKADKQVSEILHDIETRNMNAYQGYYLSKELQKVLEARRCWKDRRYEYLEAFKELGGEEKLKALRRKRENRVKRYLKGNGWKNNFSKEALAILEGSAV